MFRIIDRYLFREALAAWIVVTGVLLVILLSNQFARVLGLAASGQVPRGAVFTLLGLTSIEYLTVVIPIGLFLAIMLALARIYRDSEMAALLACGVGPARLYRSLTVLAVLVGSLLAWLALDVSPWAAESIHVIKRTARRDAEFRSLEAGRFQSVGGGETVVYAEEVDPDGRLRNVFVQHRRGDALLLAVAARGEQRETADENRELVILFNGKRYEGVPGTAAFRVISFAEHGIPVDIPQPDLSSDDPDLLPTPGLFGSTDPYRIAELAWRLSAPISALVLTLLAVPLSRTRPRQGRYGKFAVAVLIYLIYSNLLGAGRVWLERETVPPWLGLWWVHGLLLALALILLHRQVGGRPRPIEQPGATA